MWLSRQDGVIISAHREVAKHAGGKGHDQKSHGSWAHGSAPKELMASKGEWDKARAQAKKKIADAPVPSQAAVDKALRDLETASRAGGESRGGNSRDRRNQRRNLFKEFGGEEKGYVVCHGSGVKLHWSRDPKENPNGYPVLTRGKIFVKKQGGAYRLSNLLPEFLAYNQWRGADLLRQENAEFV